MAFHADCGKSGSSRVAADTLQDPRAISIKVTRISICATAAALKPDVPPPMTSHTGTKLGCDKDRHHQCCARHRRDPDAPQSRLEDVGQRSGSDGECIIVQVAVC